MHRSLTKVVARAVIVGASILGTQSGVKLRAFSKPISSPTRAR